MPRGVSSSRREHPSLRTEATSVQSVKSVTRMTRTAAQHGGKQARRLSTSNTQRPTTASSPPPGPTARTTAASPATRSACSCASSRWPSPNSAAHDPRAGARIPPPIHVVSLDERLGEQRLQLPRAQIPRGVEMRIDVDERVGAVVLERRRRGQLTRRRDRAATPSASLRHTARSRRSASPSSVAGSAAPRSPPSG